MYLYGWGGGDFSHNTIQASHAALEDFRGLKMQHNMSVQEYNAVYLHKRQEVYNLPHIDAPDATAQATIYSSGLHGHLKSKVEGRLDISMLM